MTQPNAIAPVMLLLALAPFPPLAHAQEAPPAKGEGLTVSGSVRLRAETITGQARARLSASDDLINLRSRLFAEYDFGAVRIGGELFDSRVYGADRDSAFSANEVNALEPVQAYVAADWAGGSAQVGRFMLNLGSRRLVAADDFRNTTAGSTGVRFDLRDATIGNATFIYVLPQRRLPDDFESIERNEVGFDRESLDLKLFGGLVTKPLGAGVSLEPTYFRLEERDQRDLATRDRRLDTVGVRLFRARAPGRVDFDVEWIRQGGSIAASMAANAPRQNVDAGYLHAEAGYRWASTWRPRVALEYDRASGDKPGGDFERFDTLFGMRRAEIAPSGLYNAVGRANVESIGVRLEAEPSKRLDAFVTLKSLQLASRFDAFSTTGVVDRTGAAGSDAGTQLDARVRYWLKPGRLRLEATAVQLWKSDFFERAGANAAGEDTRYLAVDLTARF